MSCERARPWDTSSPNGSEGERMSEFVMGLLTGAVMAAGAIALGMWLLKQ